MKIEINLNKSNIEELETVFNLIKQVSWDGSISAMSPEYNTILNIFDLLYTSILKQKRIDAWQNAGDSSCKTCTHDLHFHSTLGDMICTQVNCGCMSYVPPE